jgi:hypothetical protein
MLRLKSFALGAVAFLAAHFVESRFWRQWFEPGGGHQPWFLNSGRGVALTTAVLGVAAVLAAVAWARDQSDANAHALNLAIGAALAMGLTLLAIGPGTIFPIVLLLGLVLFVSFLGLWLGFAATWRWRRPRNRNPT